MDIVLSKKRFEMCVFKISDVQNIFRWVCLLFNYYPSISLLSIKRLPKVKLLKLTKNILTLIIIFNHRFYNTAFF